MYEHGAWGIGAESRRASGKVRLPGAHALRSTGHRLRYFWDDAARLAHQMMERARTEREASSWMSRSIGSSNGRDMLRKGACRSRGVGVRCVVIPRARERQNPRRTLRA